jgi:serine/threonine protein kinase
MVKQINNKIQVKIADFSLIAFHEFTERSQTHTEDRRHIRYAAPEVLNGNQYDTKPDIYSLGIILQNLFEVNFDGWVQNELQLIN